jgi:hypothetical protein
MEVDMPMISFSVRRDLFAVLLCVSTTYAGATAQRTFVASNGDDLNSCAITTPCRSFARAITQTNTNGEIIVLDSAGYGPVSVGKSVAIVAPAGNYAGVSVFSGIGILINGAGINVVLRGLTINGQGGDTGIYYTFGGSLRVQNCIVRNMASHGIVAGYAGDVTIEDSVIEDNGGNGVHILLNPTITISHTTIQRNDKGIHFSPSGGDSKLAVIASDVVHNALMGIWINPMQVGASVSVSNTTFAHNGNIAVRTDSPDASSPILVLLNNNTIVHNNAGVYAYTSVPGGATKAA